MTTIDLDRLDKLAEAATPGPWKHGPLYWEVWRVTQSGEMMSRVAGVGQPHRSTAEADAAYIAAFSPDVARALLARLRAAEAALSEIAEDGCDNEGLDEDLGDCLDLESPVPCGPCRARAALDVEAGKDARAENE
jgi:hypothetical protein